MKVDVDKKDNWHFLRHGKTEAGSVYIGSTDARLSPLGWKQMWQAIARNSEIDTDIRGSAFPDDNSLQQPLPWDIIISSPLQRCADFAQQLSQKYNIPYQLEEEIREYHFGVWENQSALSIMEQYPGKLEAFWQDPLQFPAQGAESLLAFAARIDQCLARLKQQYSQQRVLVVTHGGVIRYLLSVAQQQPLSAMLSMEIAHGELKSIDISSLNRCLKGEC